jgi:hypothetical protein
LGEGTPVPSDESAVAEVEALMAELRRAAARRQVAEQDLQASKDQLQAIKDRLQIALSAAHLGWRQYDPLRVSAREASAAALIEPPKSKAKMRAPS